jgi:hypothetical protein
MSPAPNINRKSNQRSSTTGMRDGSCDATGRQRTRGTQKIAKNPVSSSSISQP